jgi:hypothetical protein
MHSGTQALMDEVHRKTGYPVTTDAAEDVTDHARMISARPETPFHLVQVNAKHRAQAPYIVAAQCTMLLITWSDPANVPALSLRQDKADYWTGTWAKSKQLSSVDPDSARNIASIWIRGIANQLFSSPLEIRVARILFNEHPDLRNLQASLFDSYLRQLTTVLSPQFRESAPADLFEKNSLMNASMVLAWSRLSGQKAPTIPFESLGLLPAAEKLLASLDKFPEPTSADHMATVDAWAGTLSMSTLYEWKTFDRRA